MPSDKTIYVPCVNCGATGEVPGPANPDGTPGKPQTCPICEGNKEVVFGRVDMS